MGPTTDLDRAYMAKHSMTPEQFALMEKLLFSTPNTQWPPHLLTYIQQETSTVGISGTLIEQCVRQWIRMTWDG